MKPGSTFLFYFDIFMFFFTNGILDLFLLLHKSENDVNKKMYNDFRNRISCEFYIFTFCVKKDESHTSLKLHDD